VEGGERRELADVSALASRQCASDAALVGVRESGLRFLSRLSARHQGNGAALEALRAGRRSRSWRGAGAGLRRKNVWSGDQGSDGSHGGADRSGDGTADQGIALDERRDEEAGAREAARDAEQGRLSGEVAR